MNAALRTAIEYAERGWFVFPIKRGTKSPFKDFKWKEKSTKNLKLIKATATNKRYKGCNWALDTGKSGVLVVDLDTGKAAGGRHKQGLENALKLPEYLDTPLIVETPSGGRHHYYVGVGPCTGPKSPNKLAVDIDTRGVGGYVLIPGSVNGKKKPYTYLEQGDPDPLPNWISEHLGKVPEKKEDRDEPVTELDQTHNVERALSWLKCEAPEAIEGSGGEHTTYKIACKLRDLGVSEDKALELMLEDWNEAKATPPWGPDELQKKINNAYTYANDKPGNSTPEAVFPDLPRSTKTIRSAADITDKDVKPRKWLMHSRYIRKIVTVTVAPGGAGKSALTIVEGLAIASGKTLTENKVVEQTPIWYYNTEDDFDELHRRVRAAAIHHKLSKEDIKDFYYTSVEAHPLVLVSESRDGFVVNDKAVEWLIEEIKTRKVGLFVVDPFIDCHEVNENDNKAINLVVKQFKRVAAATDCAISIVHHVTKGSNSVHGNMDKARGASSLVGAARIAHTLYPMSEKEGKLFGLGGKQHLKYAKLDNAKANLAPRDGKDQWYQHVSVPMMWNSKESMGTMEVSNIEQVKEESSDETIMGQIYRVIRSGRPERESTLYKVAQEIEPYINGLKARAISRRIERMFTIAVRNNGKLYAVRLMKSSGGAAEVQIITCVEE